MENLDKESVSDLNLAKRVDEIRLLVVGMGRLGAVVVREAVKAGVKSVTMMDDRPWTEDDKRKQFFIPPESEFPENRAEASLERAQTLNHQVEVFAETSSVAELDEQFFGSGQPRWNVLVAANLEQMDTIKLNELCRKVGIKFIAAYVFGSFGSFFIDFLDVHAYTKTVQDIGNSECLVYQSENFVPFSSLIDKLEVKHYMEDLAWVFILRAHLTSGLCRVEGSKSSPEYEEGVHDLIEYLKLDICMSTRNEDIKINDDYIDLTLDQCSPAVCQLIGVLVFKEAVKGVTRKSKPFNNLYIFHPIKRVGLLYTIRSGGRFLKGSF